MEADNLFGVLLLFVSVLGALFFMIALIRRELITSKVKSDPVDKKFKSR